MMNIEMIAIRIWGLMCMLAGGLIGWELHRIFH